jgi:Rps23 Pro-64 3,4-dihydroxylase Tpa1-like proline 4-hydroxylase
VISAQAAVSKRQEPFPHVLVSRALSESLGAAVLAWFETEAPWQLRIESFYEQYELNLHQVEFPAGLACLTDPAWIGGLADALLSPLSDEPLSLVEANAHKLLPGQTIKIHNDFIGGEETHRILIQVNRDWTESKGGLLMLFSSASVDDVARVVRPLHASAVGFEISPVSFHAVSTIHAGERYTLVYSFKPQA